VLEEHAVMLREIALQPEFVRASLEPAIQAAADAFATRPARRAAHGIAIGCGDSYCAALAARGFMMAASTCWIEPLEALEFSSYLVHDLPAGGIVIGVSNSGTVTRTIEGVRAARERDAWTFALTTSPDNALARAAESLLLIDAVPNIKRRSDGSTLVTPGTITYTASLLGLCAAALALGERNGAHAAVADARAALRGLADWMDAAESAVAAPARDLAATFTRDRTTVILGGGPNLATAYYGMAKWFEALQWPAHYAQIEEWAHEQYFFTGPQTDTIVILPPGGSHARGLEQLRAAREMGARTIAIGSRDDAEARAAADVFFAMPPDVPETLTPFVYKLPFEHLTAHIASAHGIDFFGFANPQRQAVNFRQIFGSKAP
jgi:glucosamine 6-phosphate synthetase-like amidotransferase/phosphosugar isomerase protein